MKVKCLKSKGFKNLLFQCLPSSLTLLHDRNLFCPEPSSRLCNSVTAFRFPHLAYAQHPLVEYTDMSTILSMPSFTLIKGFREFTLLKSLIFSLIFANINVATLSYVSFYHICHSLPSQPHLTYGFPVTKNIQTSNCKLHHLLFLLDSVVYTL